MEQTHGLGPVPSNDLCKSISVNLFKKQHGLLSSKELISELFASDSPGVSERRVASCAAEAQQWQVALALGGLESHLVGRFSGGEG